MHRRSTVAELVSGLLTMTAPASCALPRGRCPPPSPGAGCGRWRRRDTRRTRTRSPSSSWSRLAFYLAGYRLPCTQCHSAGTKATGTTPASAETAVGVATPAARDYRASGNRAARFERRQWAYRARILISSGYWWEPGNLRQLSKLGNSN